MHTPDQSHQTEHTFGVEVTVIRGFLSGIKFRPASDIAGRPIRLVLHHANRCKYMLVLCFEYHQLTRLSEVDSIGHRGGRKSCSKRTRGSGSPSRRRTSYRSQQLRLRMRVSRLQSVLAAGMRMSTIEALPMKMATGTYGLRS
jgi:hypothetical protein